MNRSKFYILSIALLLVPCLIQAQQEHYQRMDSVRARRAKAIYVEALGSSGLGISLNYDMRFKPGHRGWGFRAGISQPTEVGSSKTYLFPVLLNHVNAARRVAFEAGAGFTVAYRQWTYEDQNNVIHHNHEVGYPAVANVGVRFQPLRTGIVWRLYWAPVWQLGSSQQAFTSWFGTSLGIGFN